MISCVESNDYIIRERSEDKTEVKQVTSYATFHGSWFTQHSLKSTPIDKILLLKFLRD